MVIAAFVIASLFFAVGIVGTFAPVLPGAPLIWLGMLIFGIMTGFEKLGWLFYLLQGLLAVAVLGVDYLATALGSRYFGASKAAALGALLGLVVGLFFFPIGLLVGPFAGAVLFELILTRQPENALRSGLGAVIGFWSGAAIKLILEIGMIVWFFIEVL
ncbi:MAG: DUF456 domain-containing protein [Firmicutes bacterium]|nr:DUF456 domain-containing protein [Bacillota bacterium]HPU01281.1 DUF456 family protein [Bacillota bacterium]